MPYCKRDYIGLEVDKQRIVALKRSHVSVTWRGGRGTRNNETVEDRPAPSGGVLNRARGGGHRDPAITPTLDLADLKPIRPIGTRPKHRQTSPRLS